MEKIAKIDALYYSNDIIAERHTFLNASPCNLKTHSHEAYQMGITFRDPGSYYVGESFFKIKKGTFFCFHPGVPHASIGRVNKKSIQQSVTIYLSGDLLKMMNAQLFNCDEYPYFSDVFYDDPEICDLFTGFFDGVWNQSHGRASHLLHLLFFKLVEKYSGRQTVVRKKHEVVTALRSYVFSQMDKPVSLSTFVEIYGMSMSTLSRVFKRSMGMSPYIYVNQLRIETAKELLKHRLPSKEIARLTGHYDESHLRKNFKQYVGVTPAGYKVCK